VRARGLIVGAVLVVPAGVMLGGCDSSSANAAFVVKGGDPSQGPPLIRYYGCAACHTIPGVPGATGHVGPPLAKFRNRTYIAGVLSNNAENLVLWIQHPRKVSAHTAMPETGISDAEARHVAAYLYSR
jgi:cytochrome c